MDKTIGKPVTNDELSEVLDREKKREELREQLEEEMKAIKPGECLVYEAKEGMGSLASFGLSLFVDKLGLKMITEGDKAYIYREKEEKK